MKKTTAIISILSLVFALALGVTPTFAATATIVSDTTNTTVVGDTPLAVTPHAAWTASIPDATWIWKTGATAANEVVAFEQDFTVLGAVISAELNIATDNSYEVFIDNVLVAADAAVNNFQLATQDVHDLTADVTTGTHTLRVEVKNVGTYNAQSNPAGLLYKFEVESDECCDCCGVTDVINLNQDTTVINGVHVGASTGGNDANGGSGGSGGSSGSADVNGTDGDNNTATSGAGGAGGNGGSGGGITTGNASAGSLLGNVVNTNSTTITRGGTTSVLNANVGTFNGNFIGVKAKTGWNATDGGSAGSGGTSGSATVSSADDDNTATSGAGGAGGNGGNGGTTSTGIAGSLSDIFNQINFNLVVIN